jgi:hypothetical protein
MCSLAPHPSWLMGKGPSALISSLYEYEGLYGRHWDSIRGRAGNLVAATNLTNYLMLNPLTDNEWHPIEVPSQLRPWLRFVMSNNIAIALWVNV